MSDHTAVIEQSEAFYSALLDALLEHEDLFGTPFVGNRDWNTTDYPASELIPESATYQPPNEYQYQARVNLYFHRSRLTDYIGEIIPALSAIVESGVERLRETPLYAFRVSDIEYFIGSDFESTSLVMISLRWTAEGPVDLANR